MNKNIISWLIVVLVLIGGAALYLNSAPVANKGNGKTENTTSGVSGTATSAVVGSAKSEKLGEYLTDIKGMTLYVFADDKKSTSSCVGECSKNWPPFVYDNKNLISFTDLLSKRMNVAKRNDGSYQYAYGEKPVYYYVGDKNPGDMNGNGLDGGKWSVVSITK